jgi:hypothetical protein
LLTPAVGTLVGGASTNVSLSLDASSLAPNTYTDIVSFINLSGGLGDTSRSVDLTVAVHPPVLRANPQTLPNWDLVMTLQGVTNKVYPILGTTNLSDPVVDWPEVRRLTNTSGQTPFTITNPASVGAQQYYRAREL